MKQVNHVIVLTVPMVVQMIRINVVLHQQVLRWYVRKMSKIRPHLQAHYRLQKNGLHTWGPYHIYIAKIPADIHTLSGKTFYIYNPEKIIPLASMSKRLFLSKPDWSYKKCPTIPIGTTALASRNIFNLAQLQSESKQYKIPLYKI